MIKKFTDEIYEKLKQDILNKKVICDPHTFFLLFIQRKEKIIDMSELFDIIKKRYNYVKKSNKKY